MKTLRISMITTLATLAVSAAVAGPGIGYWNSRTTAKEQAPAVATTTPATPAKCEKMPVTIGRRSTMVECTGAVAETAACKAHCGM